MRNKMIDFSNGQPTSDLFLKEFLRCPKFDDTDIDKFFYYTAKKGNLSLRQKLASLFDIGAHFNEENIMVTHGALGGLNIVFHFLRNSGVEVCFVRNPTYKEALSVVRSHGIEIVEIPLLGNGNIDFISLQEVMKQYNHTCFYLIPTLNNPDGYTVPNRDRDKIIDLASKNNSFIIEDRVYDELVLTQEKYISFSELGHHKNFTNVISIMSLSKILMPGLRVGFLCADSLLLHELEKYKLDFGTSPVLCHITESMLNNEGLFHRQIQNYRISLQERMKYLSGELRKIQGLEFELPQGGYFLWVKLPGNRLADSFLSDLGGHVSFAPHKLFDPHDRDGCYARFCFGNLSFEDMSQGVQYIDNFLRSRL